MNVFANHFNSIDILYKQASKNGSFHWFTFISLTFPPTCLGHHFQRAVLKRVV